MLELLITVLGALGGGLRRQSQVVDLTESGSSEGEHPEDLPCPWCLAPTSEADAACPSCRRSFG